MKRFYPFLLAACLVLPAGAQQSTTGAQAQPPQGQQPKADQENEQPIDEMPVTVKIDPSANKNPDLTDPMGVPKLPSGKTSMIGGRLSKVDGVHNKLAVKIFGGGGTWDLAFDERTRFYRDGHETTFEKIAKGDRVYVDTMLDGHRLLARNVRVVTQTGPADARGQVTSVEDGAIRLRDSLSSQPLLVQVNNDTQVTRDGRKVSIADVHEGSLISVQFLPQKENRGVARDITVLAAPGESFTFAGRVTHLDVSSGQLAIENSTDNKTYDIAVDDGKDLPPQLTLGSEVRIAAVFDGRHYKANTINVTKEAE
jgi:hypothetical protein